jgi:tRNA(Ile)-lysidine synthase
VASVRHRLTAGFAASMARLGPFEARPRLAVAVSGGADSTAVALLAADWARQRGGDVVALIVDHGLRPASAGEAAITARRLAGRGIASRVLALTGLRHGPALAERARRARYEILLRKCQNEGILHLLLGHHASDQAETLMMRVLGGSGDRGLAAMPAVAETHSVRLLRPVLDVMPETLREFLRDQSMEWVEDPSNRDLAARRPRLRTLTTRYDPTGTSTQRLATAAHTAGRQRAAQDLDTAAFMAAHVTIRPEGFALIPATSMPPEVLAAVVQTISGAAYPPRIDSVAPLAANPQPATLAGVRLMLASRLGAGLLAVREEHLIGAPVPAESSTLWDGRFQFASFATPPPGLMIGALGDDAARFRRISRLPSAVLRVLPALRDGNLLAAVPHLLYPDPKTCSRMRLVFSPRRPLAGAPFLPADPSFSPNDTHNGDAGRHAAPYVGIGGVSGSAIR